MNLFRPNIGHSAIDLLERAGCSVEIPQQQTCCGQPALSSGEDHEARAIARQTIALFEGFDYVVAPSGSCAGTLRSYPQLLADDPAWAARAERFAQRSHELLAFLGDVRGLGPADIRAQYSGRATYHDSCSGLRQLGIRDQPRRLLAGVEGLVLTEMDDTEVCCGFGGSFCIKYPAISEKMVDDKLRAIEASGADTLLGGDLGCLLNIAGRLRRRGSPIKVYHAAELLAGRGSEPAIGAGDPE